MSVQLGSKFSFPAYLVANAVGFPSGHYVAVDDAVFAENGLGSKIVQTQLAQIHGREVSVGYVNDEDTGYYNLVFGDENPRDLGSFDDIMRRSPALFAALQQVFGNSIASYTHLEMVMALTKAMDEGVSEKDDTGVRRVAAWARTTAKRAVWVVKNPMEAAIQSPVDWEAAGL